MYIVAHTLTVNSHSFVHSNKYAYKYTSVLSSLRQDMLKTLPSWHAHCLPYCLLLSCVLDRVSVMRYSGAAGAAAATGGNRKRVWGIPNEESSRDSQYSVNRYIHRQRDVTKKVFFPKFRPLLRTLIAFLLFYLSQPSSKLFKQ